MRMRAENDKKMLELSPALLAFIRRRSMRFIEPYKSLEVMVGGAYIQGMNDALDVLNKAKEGL